MGGCVSVNRSYRLLHRDDTPSFSAARTNPTDGGADRLVARRLALTLLNADSPNRRTPKHSTDDATALQRIHLAVRELLRHRGAVALADRQITLQFDRGVIARCSRCSVMWRVSRAHYATLSWWCCPSGCWHQRDQAYKR
jgi:hypothetical protein